jgi:diketogulonate reductase-like aldo/keto reductase
LVGEALQILKEKHNIQRGDLFIQTKYTPIGGQDLTKPLPYDKHSPIATQVATSVDTSLKNLRTTYLDSCLLHSPLATIALTVQAWRALGALQDAGTVRTIGVSNTYDVRVLRSLAEERPVQVVQNRWHQGNQWDHEVHAYCMENGIQYQSFWTLTSSPALLTHSSVRALAERAQCTPEQVVFKLARKLGVTPLTGTTSEVHMREDLAVEGLGLGDEDGEDLKSALAFIGGES